MTTAKWDRRFLELAKHISEYSKDPSTKVGAVIVDKQNRIISTGFNGFPKGVEDLEEDYANREIKYLKVVHAEANALMFARQDLTGCTIYTWPMMPCSTCGGLIIQSGIVRVVAPTLSLEHAERWGKNMKITAQMFDEAGVELVLVEL